MFDSMVFCVVGQDLDHDFMQSQPALGDGDKVLVEMNGTRIFSNSGCPLVVEDAWEVIRSDSDGIVLSHPKLAEGLMLPIDALVSHSGEPAVWQIEDKRFAQGPIYCLLQFVAYHVAQEDVKGFKPAYDIESFDEILLNKPARDHIQMALIKRLQKLQHPGWGYNSLCRFSLRSNVRAKVINAFRKSDWEVIEKQDDDVLKKIIGELGWVNLQMEVAGIPTKIDTFDFAEKSE